MTSQNNFTFKTKSPSLHPGRILRSKDSSEVHYDYNDQVRGVKLFVPDSSVGQLVSERHVGGTRETESGYGTRIS